jgi:hypothetical protein
MHDSLPEQKQSTKIITFFTPLMIGCLINPRQSDQWQMIMSAVQPVMKIRVTASVNM